MKFVLICSMVFSINAFASKSKSPDAVDLSVKDIVAKICDYSGYFNPLICEKSIDTCYRKYNWPSVIDADLKLDVVTKCIKNSVRF